MKCLVIFIFKSKTNHIKKSNNILSFPIEYLKGVGPTRGELLKKELGIFFCADLLKHYPFRYVDKTKVDLIRDIDKETEYVQLRCILRRVQTAGDGRRKRLTGRVRDASGTLNLVWFQRVSQLEKWLVVGQEYLIYGKISFYGDTPNMVHPEIEALDANASVEQSALDPVYPSTEKLKMKGLDAKGIRKLVKTLFEKLPPEELEETLPEYLMEKLRLPSLYKALRQIHLPKNYPELQAARKRLKFEELFFHQLMALSLKGIRKQSTPGYVFPSIGNYFNKYFKEILPFELTGAQKRVIKEVRRDLGQGAHMNRLLQGDVGSGKTIVALMCMLIAIDNGFQACLMAPTEILASQHYESLQEDLEKLGLKVAFLSGSIKGKKRKLILEELAEGNIDILIGTHALIEDPVIFKNLGLAIIDEQHRFGVAQRAKLWKKGITKPPHVLVMTATPIPRTLAMTVYGDLDVSVIDELPPGRKPVETIHRMESHRLSVFGLMKSQIAEGRQIYVVYPLIEESETLDLNNLMEGYESLSRYFQKPNYQISIVHGRMKANEKEFEMQRFLRKETQIMVATTVIEVGVNVPNASVMVIENTERFGLSQLHQLRGRVGRGADKAYCILMSGYKLSAEAKERIKTMVATNNGFEIAEADMRLRGHGNIEGTRQSGVLQFKIADLSKDLAILEEGRKLAIQLLTTDPGMEHPKHLPLRKYLQKYLKKAKGWSRIS